MEKCTKVFTAEKKEHESLQSPWGPSSSTSVIFKWKTELHHIHVSPIYALPRLHFARQQYEPFFS